MTGRNPHYIRIENVAEGSSFRYVPLHAFDYAAGTRLHKHGAAEGRPGIARYMPQFTAPASTIFTAEGTPTRSTTIALRLAAATTSALNFFSGMSLNSPSPANRRCLSGNACLRLPHVAFSTPPMPDRMRKLCGNWK